MNLHSWRSWIAIGLLAGTPQGTLAESGHSHGHEHGAHHAHDESAPGKLAPDAGLAATWSALLQTRDEIAADVNGGGLDAVHAKALQLASLAETFSKHTGSLNSHQLARVQGAAKQIARVADLLHDAADAGNRGRAKRELGRLDTLLQLIRAQYPEAELEPGKESTAHHSDHAHAHTGPAPSGLVHSSAQATISVRTLDMKFEPRNIELEVGVPTRLELVNVGATEHSLVVRTPDGTRDWIHLHAQAGASDAGVYKLDQPGRYPIVCSIPGHTEAGMAGELVVKSATAHAHPAGSHAH